MLQGVAAVAGAVVVGAGQARFGGVAGTDQNVGEMILFEGNLHSFRQIFLDRGHPKDLNPTWWGDSVGHWEGDTLAVDVTRLTDETWLGDNGLFHSRKLHVTERLRRVGDDRVVTAAAASKKARGSGRLSM